MHLASQAARTRATASSRGMTRLPFTWPHDLGHTCGPGFKVQDFGVTAAQRLTGWRELLTGCMTSKDCVNGIV